jgi:hypothetical protein
VNTYKSIAAVALVALPLTQAGGCGGEGGPARSATHAGDGITQFGDPNGPKNYANQGASGKLKFDRTYNAHKQKPSDVQNCRWTLYYFDAEGVYHLVKKGNYSNAKVKVGAQATRKFFLKSLQCGLWE